MQQISPNTKAILLLTAPLGPGRKGSEEKPLGPAEYNRLAHFLHGHNHEPADLTAPDAGALIESCAPIVDVERMRALLLRGFRLARSVEEWHSRAIWVVSRADGEYPQALKRKLKGHAPPVLYGCGDIRLMETGGLAVVGSRRVDDELLSYSAETGRLAAAAARTIVSGGAKGIDRAAMQGCLEAGGAVVGVVADSLARRAVDHEYLTPLRKGKLVLVSACDPDAGFHVGTAMQRNKLIYACSDAALVVSSDLGKGGTWTGAVEQLEKLRLVPVHVRTAGEGSEALEALRRKGAVPWPEPESPEKLVEILERTETGIEAAQDPGSLFSGLNGSMAVGEEAQPMRSERPAGAGPATGIEQPDPAARESLMAILREPLTARDVADRLGIPATQAREWLKRLSAEGKVRKLAKPVRYVMSGDVMLL